MGGGNTCFDVGRVSSIHFKSGLVRMMLREIGGLGDGNGVAMGGYGENA